MKAAQQLSVDDYHFIGTPWSPPSWMKTNGMFNGTGKLIPEMQQPGQIFVRFFDAYQEEGLSFYGFTVQNEPYAGSTDWDWNCCHFTAEDEKVFVRDYLGPTLQAAGYDDLKLLIGDGNLEIYPQFIENILEDEECASFVDGIAVHWYVDDYRPETILTQLHEEFPNNFILHTEACTGN
ncbi:putative glucosylceramidase 4 [Armadillidium vulgare]|nr:putative glucosylceramidase 4 [Armadillidium vulgare]